MQVVNLNTSIPFLSKRNLYLLARYSRDKTLMSAISDVIDNDSRLKVVETFIMYV